MGRALSNFFWIFGIFVNFAKPLCAVVSISFLHAKQTVQLHPSFICLLCGPSTFMLASVYDATSHLKMLTFLKTGFHNGLLVLS